MTPNGVDFSFFSNQGALQTLGALLAVLQAVGLLLQTAWGPRWFVPKRFLPAKYDYHRPVVPREVAEGVLDSSSSSPSDVETGDGGRLSLPE